MRQDLGIGKNEIKDRNSNRPEIREIKVRGMKMKVHDPNGDFRTCVFKTA